MNHAAPLRPPRSIEELTKSFYGSTAKVGEPFNGYQNPFGRQPDWSYAWTQMRPYHLQRIERMLPHQRIRFAVEVGSFTGGAARVMGRFLRERARASGQEPAPLLCIDTWLGDVNMALGRLGDLAKFIDRRNGQPTLYHLWLVNMISANLTESVVPFVAPSTIGARALELHRYAADLIYLDSAHEMGETFLEMGLYWDLLTTGGVLMGDDLNWWAVAHDVQLFARVQAVEVQSFNGCHRDWLGVTGRRGNVCVWFLQKPPGDKAAARASRIEHRPARRHP